MTYAILYNPGHNRVYFETSLKLSLSEFSIVSQSFSTECRALCQQELGGIDYLSFETDNPLSPSDITAISHLSFFYALFQLEKMDGRTALLPISREKGDFIDRSMSAMLKYTGKTNELFTRMMINIAAASQGERDRLRLLDPIAGKGTTLYEGLIRGFDVYGIEIGGTVVNESYHFVKRFLETARYKYQDAAIRISGPNRSFSALRHTIQTAPTKEAVKNGEARTIELIAGNALYADSYFKKDFFDIIVGDLPYGVQHGNVTSEKQSSLTRNPSQLLAACLPAWKKVLKPGGAMVLAWNSNVLPRDKMERLLEQQGFTVNNSGAYLQFEHRVDQSIRRDVVAAQKR